MKVLKRMISTLIAVALLPGMVGCASGDGDGTEPMVTVQPSGDVTEPAGDVTEPDVTGPAGSGDVAGPEASEPDATEPTGSETAGPDVTDPAGPDVTDPGATVPGAEDPTEPGVTGPTEAAPTEPEVTEPTDPPATKPAPTEPPVTQHVHKYTSKVIKPTCTAEGYTKYTCSCGDSYKDDYVAAKGHSYSSKVVKPTCESDGYTVYTCSCGDRYEGDYTEKLLHNWSDWTVLTEATYYSCGEKQHSCDACGKNETQIIEMLEMPLEMKQQEVLRLVNEEREKVGLDPLEYYFAGQDAADIRAKEITTFFSHNRPDGTLCWTALADLDITYYSAGENIAYGQSTPEAVVTAWMNSEGHRENILNPYFTHLIVGVEGTYWVQLFFSDTI